MTRPAWSSVAHLTSRVLQSSGSLQVPFDSSGNYTVQFTVGLSKAYYPPPVMTVGTFADLATIPAITRFVGMLVLVSSTNQTYQLAADLTTWNLYPTDPFLSGDITPTAEIIWSLGGNTTRRVVSVFNGMSISGTAEHVNVRVSDETDLLNITQQQKYDVVIMVAKGLRAPTGQPATYTQNITQVGGGGSRFGSAILGPGQHLDIPVPRNSGVVSAYVTVESIGTLSVITELDMVVEQYTINGVQLRGYDPRLLGWVPISPQCDVIQLQNRFGAGSGKNLLFALTYGIDG